MESYPRAAVERAMKVQEVILRAMAKKNYLGAGRRDHWVMRTTLPAGWTGWRRTRSRPHCERLAYFGKSANLRFQSLVVLPLDLKFGL
jgi:hypothetical protein